MKELRCIRLFFVFFLVTSRRPWHKRAAFAAFTASVHFGHFTFYGGFGYYFRAFVKEGPVNYDQPPFWVSDAFDICDNPHLRKTEWMDKGIDPMGLHIGMRKVYNRYRLPMIVTENGMAYSETLGPDGQIHDPYRIEYLKEHIEQLAIMIDEGLPVFGYCPWSFVDVVSSHQGFAKRYGLVYVDRTETDPKQCARVKKDSFYWYKKVIASNGEDLT